MWDLDPTDPVPVYEQLARRVRYAVAEGRWGVGDRLPSVREMARTARVNPNTAARVYRSLETEGVLRTESGRGVFVAEEGPDICRRAGAAHARDVLHRAAREALRAGLSPDEIHARVSDALEGAPATEEVNP